LMSSTAIDNLQEGHVVLIRKYLYHGIQSSEGIISCHCAIRRAPSPFLRYFLLALSLQPCYNPIETHSTSWLFLTLFSKGSRRGCLRRFYRWRLPMTAPRP
jgi:hypothetical protein